MRILLISDIGWGNEQENRLEYIKNKISKIKPSLVLMAGDVIGECRTIHDADFLDLLEFLDKEKINSFFIQGNHDEVPAYESLLIDIKNLHYIKEISNKIVEFDNIKILGIPFSFTNNLKYLRKINEIYPEQVDIILAHSEYARRIWLFDLKSKFIITGHFENQLCQILDKVLIAVDGFPDNYAIIDYETTELTITFFRRRFSLVRSADKPELFIKDGLRKFKYRLVCQYNGECVSQAKLLNGKLVWKRDEHQVGKIDKHRIDVGLEPLNVKGSKYVSIAENLILAKKKIAKADINEQKEIIENLLKIEIPKTHIEKYLGI